jgi:uncharacterized paraquat-inducible protein A
MSESENGNDGMGPVFSLEDRMETQEAHIKDIAESLGHCAEALRISTNTIGEMMRRIQRLENKTQGLSDRPASRNCPKCHKLVTTARGVCGACGTRLA